MKVDKLLRSAHLQNFLGLGPKSATHCQCNARPTVTFPAAGGHRSVDRCQIIGDKSLNNLHPACALNTEAGSHTITWGVGEYVSIMQRNTVINYRCQTVRYQNPNGWMQSSTCWKGRIRCRQSGQHLVAWTTDDWSCVSKDACWTLRCVVCNLPCPQLHNQLADWSCVHTGFAMCAAP